MPLEGAVSTNTSNGSNATNGTKGKAWGLWAVGAAIPLSLAGVALYWLRRRVTAVTENSDTFEDWWQARHRARENATNGAHRQSTGHRPEGSNPLFV